jgi:hypothetical protein
MPSFPPQPASIISRSAQSHRTCRDGGNEIGSRSLIIEVSLPDDGMIEDDKAYKLASANGAGHAVQPNREEPVRRSVMLLVCFALGRRYSLSSGDHASRSGPCSSAAGSLEK